MAKNIILCSDGTGQKGGEGPDTNVFRLYKMVDNDHRDQLAFYDDGIGTDSNVSFLQAMSSAFGFGFGKNIITLYKQLVRHYTPGDKIFLYGYSRGAATVRALAGMIQTVGLLRNDDEDITRGSAHIIDEIKFHLVAMKAMYYYRGASKNPSRAERFKKDHTYGAVDIEFIGVWDTVESLGFPKESSWIIIGASMFLDRVMDRFFSRSSYNLQLDRNVKQVYHAIAVDETRYSFKPVVWDETAIQRPKFIKQVWFPGSHGNVGGGAERTELSSITLNWIMRKSEQLGVRFYERKTSDVAEEMNLAGKLYNPRKGIKNYYRFGPRHIRDLCTKDGKSIIDGKILIHESVFKRIDLTEYYPVLPNEFQIVGDDRARAYVYHEESEYVKRQKQRVNLLHKIKKWSYHVLVETTVVFAGLVWYTNQYLDEVKSDSVLFNTLTDVLPGMMYNFMYFSTHMYPWAGAVFATLFLGVYFVNKVNKILIDRTLKKINWNLMNSIDKSKLR